MLAQILVMLTVPEVGAGGVGIHGRISRDMKSAQFWVWVRSGF